VTARAGRAARVAAVLLLAALPFHAGLVGGELIAWRDLTDHFYPRCHVIGEALARGELPRWDPLVFHGASWFGTRSPGVLYPGHLVFAVLPLGVAMATFMALHVALAILGGRALLGRVVGSDAAWAGGLAYGLGGFVVSQHWVLTYLVSAALLPWAALGGLLAVERPWRGAAVVAAAVGLTLVAVDPQGALVASIVALGLALAHPHRRAPTVVVLGIVLAGLLAAPQLVPLLLELPQTDRVLDGWRDDRYGAPPLGLAASLVAPGVLGEWSVGQLGYWGRSAWRDEVPWCGLSVGVTGLVAAVAAVADRERWRLAWPGAGLLALGLTLAWSDLGRVVGLRFSAKWLVLSALGLAWLVGIGWSALATPVARWSVRGYAGLGVLGAVIAAAAASRWSAELAASSTLDEAAVRTSAGGAALRLALFALALAATVRAREDGLVRPGLARGLLVGVLALDLLSAAGSSIPGTRATFLERPALAETIAATSSRTPTLPPTLFATTESAPKTTVRFGRDDVNELANISLRDVLKPNFGQLHGIRSVFAFESTRPANLRRLQDAVRANQISTLRALVLVDAEFFVASPGAAVLSLADVVVVGPLCGGRRVGARNLACPPWAYVAGEARPAPTEEAAVTATIASDRVITRSVVLGPEGAELAGEASPVVSATVDEVEFAAERVALTVTSGAPGWLVVRESFSTDWRATLDGAPVAMARADALFRALRVPAGRSRVVMVYDPWWWTPSLLLSALGLVGLAGLVVLDRRGNREAAGGTP
jgi:hypothetical protein